MATFKTCIKTDKKRKDGFYQVFIRVIQNRKIAYIPTNKYVNDHVIQKGEVTDNYVLRYCTDKITRWMEMLNRVDCESWTVKEIVEYVKNENTDISFSDYARKFIEKYENEGRDIYINYKSALMHLESFANTDNVMFGFLTVNTIQRWIDSLADTHRAKEMYPAKIRRMYLQAMLELNDEERGIVRIKYNPWPKIKIPKADVPQKIAISPQECREFFNAPLPESKYRYPIDELARDVAMMILCLAGINTVDLYNMKKKDYYNGILHYKRAKTKDRRPDEAYMEMRVPPILKTLFDKYAANYGEYLFVFHERFTTANAFCCSVNIGMHRICESLGIAKENYYRAYTFRHTWATIAQNDCGATIPEVGFALNHLQKSRITRGYMKIDFTPAWILNEKVVEFIFFTTNKGKRSEQTENVFEFSSDSLMRGEVFFKGAIIGKIEDTGYSNAEEMIAILKNFATDIPERTKLLFRITNIDKQQTAIYERMT